MIAVLSVVIALPRDLRRDDNVMRYDGLVRYDEMDVALLHPLLIAALIMVSLVLQLDG